MSTRTVQSKLPNYFKFLVDLKLLVITYRLKCLLPKITHINRGFDFFAINVWIQSFLKFINIISGGKFDIGKANSLTFDIEKLTNQC